MKTKKRLFFVSIALIVFGYAFTKLGKVNKAIGLFSILFVATSIYVTASNIFTTKVCSFAISSFPFLFSKFFKKSLHYPLASLVYFRCDTAPVPLTG